MIHRNHSGKSSLSVACPRGLRGGLLIAALAAALLPVGMQARTVAFSVPAPMVAMAVPAAAQTAAPAETPKAEPADPGEQIRGISLWLKKTAAVLHTNRTLLWSIVMVLNTLALFAILYWVLYRGKEWSLPGAMKERSATIRQSIDEAELSWQKAQQRLAEVEARIANLAAEIAALQSAAQGEAEAEYKRLVAEARAEATTIAHQGQIEIEAASKQARQEIKALAAALVVDIAERRLRDTISPEMDREVVRGSLQALRNGRSQA